MRSVFDPFARGRLGAVARGFNARIVQTWMGRATRIARFDPARTPGVVHVAWVGAYGSVKAVRHAHGWLASTQGIRQHLVDEGLPEDRVFHLPHVLDPAPAALAADERERRRRELDLDPDSLLLLCVGRFHRERGLDLLLEALARLPATVAGRPLSLLLVGDGPQRDPLAAQARELGLDDRVRWVVGEATPWPWMALADLFVYPSRESAVGSGILEAWNHGLPVVATRTLAGSELVREPDLGTLVDVGDVPALADAVLESLEMADARRDMIINRTRLTIAEHYSPAAVVARCLEAYDRLTR